MVASWEIIVVKLVLSSVGGDGFKNRFAARWGGAYLRPYRHSTTCNAAPLRSKHSLIASALKVEGTSVRPKKCRGQ
jgi:hypothetical protein